MATIDITEIMEKVSEGKTLTKEEQKIYDDIDFNVLIIGNKRVNTKEQTIEDIE